MIRGGRNPPRQTLVLRDNYTMLSKKPVGISAVSGRLRVGRVLPHSSHGPFPCHPRLFTAGTSS